MTVTASNPTADTLFDVSCYSTSTCVAVGNVDEVGYDGNNEFYGTIDRFVDGTQTQQMGSDEMGNYYQPDAVSCAKSPQPICETAGIGGQTGDVAAAYRFQVGHETGGTLSTSDVSGGFQAVDCVNADACVAGGFDYTDDPNAGGTRNAVAARIVDGKVTSSTTYPHAPDERRQFDRVSCAAAAPCVAIDDTYGKSLEITALLRIG